MSSTGIIREMDEIGRIVLPMSMRRKLNIRGNDAFEVFVDDDRVILRKYSPGCIFCSGDDGLTEFRGKRVCNSCLAAIAINHRSCRR